MLAGHFVILAIFGIFSANADFNLPLNWVKYVDNRENYPDIDYYDCTGRHETLEQHPTDCTRFIQCDNGRAHDMACPLCDSNTGRCPREWLQFDLPSQRCEWDDIAGCHVDNPITTQAPTTTTHTPIETSAEPNDPRCPVNCEFKGVDCECGKFYQCRNGTYHEYVCPEGLQFNQDTLQCDLPAHAGCNLDANTCCECKYLETGECEAAYIFQDHDRTVSYTGYHNCVRENKSCANNLVWNSAANNADGACDFRSNVPACGSS